MSDDKEQPLSSLPEDLRAGQQPGEESTTKIPDEVWINAVGRWIDNHIRNSAVASSTEAWNRLHGVLPKLREYLETELGRK